ncbi:hypothetical protein DFH94DRAFT_847874 [Russula ochroleuca]|uniref:Uncharacterized protein n=1 Tax=Russula ochroleuca TaxID=152965 RepID=A0A9P5JXU9_9AGAM|nr:hypothetical protein DFH94DRAFT_847874 [Russula ochroleuca]
MYALSSLILSDRLPVVLALTLPPRLSQFAPPSEGPLLPGFLVASSNYAIPTSAPRSGGVNFAAQGIRLDQCCALAPLPSPTTLRPSVVTSEWDMITFTTCQHPVKSFDGNEGFNHTSKNYVNTSAPGYVYYVRKQPHDHLLHAFSTVEANWGLSSLGHGDTDKWWTGLRRFRYEHQLYRGGRTALGQPHAQKKTVPGQARVTARTQTGSSNGNGFWHDPPGLWHFWFERTGLSLSPHNTRPPGPDGNFGSGYAGGSVVSSFMRI